MFHEGKDTDDGVGDADHRRAGDETGADGLDAIDPESVTWRADGGMPAALPPKEESSGEHPNRGIDGQDDAETDGNGGKGERLLPHDAVDFDEGREEGGDDH